MVSAIIGAHSVELKTKDVHQNAAISMWISQRYSVYRKDHRPDGGWKYDKTFAGEGGELGLFYLLKDQYSELKSELGATLGKIDETYNEYPGLPITYTVRPEYVFRDNQEEAVKFISDGVNKERARLLPLQTGKGKAQPNDCKVLTARGWKYLGDLTMNDRVVSPEGGLTSIRGIYPQGMKDTYLVTFEDGRTARCCIEHLWQVSIDGRGSVRTLGSILVEMKRGKVVTIPLTKPTPGVEVKLPEPPYALARLLLSRYQTYELNLVTGEKMQTAHIPCNYMRASTAQRLELLRGIFDEIGEVIGEHLRIRLHNREMIAQIKELMWSFGGFVLHHKPANYTEEEVLDIWVENAAMFFTNPILQEKAGHCVPKTGVGIVSVVKGKPTQMRCISLTSKAQTYLTDQYVVTHNTFVSLAAAAKIGKRLGVVVLAKYLDQWVESIVKTHVTTTDRILVVSGRDSLKAVLDRPEVFIRDYDYICFSLTTLQIAVEDYRENTAAFLVDYGCKPSEIFERLGIGVVLMDEAHQHFFALYKLIVYANMPFRLALSATFNTEDRVAKKIQRMMYPPSCIFNPGAYDRYVLVSAYAYQISRDNYPRLSFTERGSTFYSHRAFEKSVFKRKDMKARYLGMVGSLVNEYYNRNYQPGDKLLVFAGMIQTATELVTYLQSTNRNRTVARFCSTVDPEYNLYNHDIVVTTHESAGTAKDIPGLVCVIQTVSMATENGNLQSIGRLRKVFDKEGKLRDLHYVYLYSPRVPKQREYHAKKLSLFEPKALKFRMFELDTLPL